MTLAHDRLGAGPPLLLIPGIGSRRQVWGPVLAALSREREVIAVDPPGFGGSPPLPPGTPSTVETLTDAVARFAGDLGLERPDVAGNSLGGGIALELARRGAARSATALSPIGFWAPAEAAYAAASLRASRRLGRTLRPRARALLRSDPRRALMFGQMFAHPTRLAPEVALEELDAFLAAPAFDATLPNSSRYVFRDPHELRVPVTIAWGSRDLLLLPWQARRARRLLPHARHVRLRGCGHVPMSDDPVAVAAVLLAGSQTKPLRAEPEIGGRWTTR